MKQNTLTKIKDWNKHWDDIFRVKILKNEDFPAVITSLIKKYLPYNPLFKCLEVGCVPGRFLIAFHRTFGYEIYGVDYSGKIDLVRKNMAINNIKDYEVYKADILKFEPKMKFDVVFSFGLIEHFIDPTPYVRKMADLVKKGGYFIIEVPNFRNLQYIIHYFSRRNLFETHNLEYMDVKKIESLVNKVSSMITIYSGYFGIIQDFPYKKTFPNNLLYHFSHGFNLLANKLSLDILLSNQWASPETVYIGRKI